MDKDKETSTVDDREQVDTSANSLDSVTVDLPEEKVSKMMSSIGTIPATEKWSQFIALTQSVGSFVSGFPGEKVSGMLNSIGAMPATEQWNQFNALTQSVGSFVSGFPGEKVSGMLNTIGAMPATEQWNQFNALTQSVGSFVSGFPGEKVSGMLNTIGAMPATEQWNQFNALTKSLGSFAAGFPGGKLSKMINSIGKITVTDQWKQFDQLNKNLTSIIATLPISKIEEVLKKTYNNEFPEDLIGNLKRITSMETPLEESNFVEDEENNSNEPAILITTDVTHESPLDWINKWCAFLLEYPKKLRQKQPALYIISYLLISVFIWNIVILPVLQDSMKEKVFNYVNQEEQSASKQVKDLKGNLSYEMNYTKEIINTVRVTQRETTVYRSDKKKSGVVDTITKNEPVIILHKKKNWSNILYQNQSGEEVTGWVFTRNLVR